tara:strand:+ start:603 stop:734 length:132 start_codon:yes stop_codon:yes gene_type:complete
MSHYFFFLVVFFALEKALAVGAPFDPGFRIVSFEPFCILLRFA